MEKLSQNIGFDTAKYLKYQLSAIKKTLGKFHDKLYIEFGGKLLQDKHSARVLPGYHEDAKLELLKSFHKKGESIFVVSSRDIIRGRIRGDFDTRYDDETLRSIKELKEHGLTIRHVAISLLEPGKPISHSIKSFEKKLRKKGIETHRFFEIKSYKAQASLMGELETNPFIEIKKNVVFILSPGGGSGKFGICLNQLYHEMKRGISPRYLKFETFPVHNLPIDHPVNLAYMAASADFYDLVMKDKRHGHATSYKRDLENYELLHMLARHFDTYGRYLRELTSATHMGINMISKGIVNDEIIQKEAAAEIARRLIRYKFEVQEGKESKKTLMRVRNILKLL